MIAWRAESGRAHHTTDHSQRECGSGIAELRAMQHLGRIRLADLRIRTKLVMILALPVLATVALAGLSVVQSVTGATGAERARRLVAAGGVAGELVEAVQRERAAAVLVSTGGGRDEDGFRRQVADTDVLVGRWRSVTAVPGMPAGLAGEVRRVNELLDGLSGLREQVLSGKGTTTSMVLFVYRALLADLISYRQGLAQVGVRAGTATGLRAAAALTQATEQLGLLQVAVVRAVHAGTVTPAAQQEIVAADTGVTEAVQAFRDLAPAGWVARLNAQVGGARVLQAERLHGVAVRAELGEPLRLGTSAAGWVGAVGARMALMHAVAGQVDVDLLGQVAAQRDGQRRTTVVLAVTVLVCLLVAAVLGWWITRSLTSALARLRAGARVVAVDRLPAMVAGLDADHADPDTVARLMARAGEPVVVDGRDEIGQVAEAFNAVAASAVRVAGEQAALRAAVSGILLSLARRLQLRADRMMTRLDGLQADEQDPERLEKIFGLDHVATTIRRLIAGLQVLSGGRAGRPTPEPVALAAVLQAAMSEIDDYQRVRTHTIDEGVLVDRDAAEELIHLLAELLDNAARFSPRDTPVVVDGGRVGDQIHLQISDSGIGIRDVEAVRDRVAHPERVDQGVAQQMGLPVVGRIAQRLGVRVWHRSEPGHGTRVDVTIPANLFVTSAVTTSDVTMPAATMPAATRPAVATSAVTSAVATSALATMSDVAMRHELSQGPMVSGPYAGQCSADATRELPSLAAASRASSPPQWPVPACGDALPAAALPEVAKTLIFDRLQRSWFDREAPGPAQAPVVPPEWQAAAVRAEQVRTAVPAATTANGLPVRQPGTRVIPAVTANAGPVAPVRRDPNELRRQMASFDSGLGRAGRRTPHHPRVEEHSR